MENRKIEYAVFSESCNDADRLVFYRVKPKNKFFSLFTRWRQVRHAYKNLPGLAWYFSVEQFRQLKENVTTKEEMEAWLELQKDISKKNRKEVADEWNSVK